MLATERAEFGAALTRLCAVFDRKADADLIGSYWRALEKMPLHGFQAASDKAAETFERMPRPSQLWTLYRDQKKRPQAVEEVVRADFDPYHCFGQRCLLRFVKERGGVQPDLLNRLIEEKNRVVGNYRLIAAEDTVTAEEVRTALFRAFRAVETERPRAVA